MANSDETTPGITIRELQRRLEAVEQSVVELGNVERLVAETVEGAVELRLELPAPRWSSGASRSSEETSNRSRTAVLVFTVAGEAGLPAGLGVQLWARGNLVRELTWWEDEDQQSYEMAGPLQPDTSPGPTAPPSAPQAGAPEPPSAAPI
jgi:hypothetical protein